MRNHQKYFTDLKIPSEKYSEKSNFSNKHVTNFFQDSQDLSQNFSLDETLLKTESNLNTINFSKTKNLISNSFWKDEEEYQPDYPNCYEKVKSFLI